MKGFIINCLVFFMIIMILPCMIIEITLLYCPNEYSYKYKYVTEHHNDIQIFLMGNSHIVYELNPESIGKGTFNFAISGRSVLYDFELAKRFLPSMRNLEYIVLPYDYQFFYMGREENNKKEIRKDLDLYEKTFKCMYYKYMGIRIDGFWYWSEILNSRLDYMSRLFNNSEELIECDSLGFVTPTPIKVRKKDWYYRSLPKIVNIKKTINLEMYHQLFEGYRTIATLARRQNAKLILISIPMYKTYRNDMIADVKREMTEFKNKLQKETPNVVHLDYTSDNRFSENDFIDSSHLSNYGSEKLSKIFSEDLRNLP